MESYFVSFGIWTECLNIITRSFHDVHEVNACRAGPVCLSVRIVQL